MHADVNKYPSTRKDKRSTDRGTNSRADENRTGHQRDDIDDERQKGAVDSSWTGLGSESWREQEDHIRRSSQIEFLDTSRRDKDVSRFERSLLVAKYED